MDQVPPFVEASPAAVAVFGSALSERIFADPRARAFLVETQPTIQLKPRLEWQFAALYVTSAALAWNKIQRHPYFADWSYQNRRDAALSTATNVLTRLYKSETPDTNRSVEKTLLHYLGPAVRNSLVDSYMRKELRDGRFCLDAAYSLDESLRQIEQSPPLFDLFMEMMESDQITMNHRHAPALLQLWKDLSFLGVNAEATALQISPKAVKKTRAFIWERARALRAANDTHAL
jgi:hypothetical protein